MTRKFELRGLFIPILDLFHSMPASDSAIGADAGPFNLTTVDYDTLALADEQFHLHTWEELRAIIGMALPLFHRHS